MRVPRQTCFKIGFEAPRCGPRRCWRRWPTVASEGTPRSSLIAPPHVSARGRASPSPHPHYCLTTPGTHRYARRVTWSVSSPTRDARPRRRRRRQSTEAPPSSTTRRIAIALQHEEAEGGAPVLHTFHMLATSNAWRWGHETMRLEASGGSRAVEAQRHNKGTRRRVGGWRRHRGTLAPGDLAMHRPGPSRVWLQRQQLLHLHLHSPSFPARWRAGPTKRKGQHGFPLHVNSGACASLLT